MLKENKQIKQKKTYKLEQPPTKVIQTKLYILATVNNVEVASTLHQNKKTPTITGPNPRGHHRVH
jgi:hypothetical protein